MRIISPLTFTLFLPLTLTLLSTIAAQLNPSSSTKFTSTPSISSTRSLPQASSSSSSPSPPPPPPTSATTTSSPEPSYYYLFPRVIYNPVYAHHHNDKLLIYAQTNETFRHNDDFAFQSNVIFYLLDLTQSWPAKWPRWVAQPLYRYPFNSYTSLALTSDGTAAFVSYPFYLQAYNVPTRLWFPPRADTHDCPMLFNVGSITDTDSGLIYGLKSSNDDVPYWMLSIFDPANGRCTTQGMAYFAIKGQGELKGVYSRAQGALFFMDTANLGNPATGKLTMYKYDIMSQTLTNITVTGTIPDARNGTCVASNADGTKVILAGGLKGANDSTTTPPVTNVTAPGHALQDIYLLDVGSLSWSRLKDAPAAYYDSVCAFQGNHLILYGGYKSFNSNNLSNYEYNTNDLAILDVKNNVWINNYTAPAMSGASAKMGLGLLGLFATALTLCINAFGGHVL
ncbi:hypothetical protein BGZ82_003350 [Podila clonocystis]|nr:hypothetical protein BGZ82_003350 [Podila clonocystis]